MVYLLKMNSAVPSEHQGHIYDIYIGTKATYMNVCIHWPSCANRAPIMVYLLKMNSGVPSEH